ncbi:MAG: diguanylate cyclase [Fibrobacter sp.]|nr:diguanylate cyclase [Fibrobacter sp.]
MELRYKRETDYHGNIFLLKGVSIAMAAYFFTWVLNRLHVFIVADHIMNPGFAISLGIFLCTLAMAKILGIHRNRTKYVLIALTVILFTSINVMMTFHSVLATSIPLILSVQYRNKKIMWYTCILSMLGQFATVFLGLRFGLCNANWLMLTPNTASEFVEAVANGTLALRDPGMPRPLAQFLFFVLPQWFILGSLVPILLTISARIEARSRREAISHIHKEQDFFTGLGNRFLYQRMLKEYYPKSKQVALMLWDIRNLKQISDEMGPEYGDTLVTMMAKSIKPFKDEVTRLFRVTGGRFALIRTGASLESCAKIAEEWRKNVDKLNEGSKVQLTAAIGYAQAKGCDCDLMIAQAEKMVANYKVLCDE